MRRKRWIILKGPDRIVIRCHVPRREPPKRSKKINPDSIITYLVLCLLDVARTHIYLEPWIHREAIVSTCTWGKNSATTALYRHINLPLTDSEGTTGWLFCKRSSRKRRNSRTNSVKQLVCKAKATQQSRGFDNKTRNITADSSGRDVHLRSRSSQV